MLVEGSAIFGVVVGLLASAPFALLLLHASTTGKVSIGAGIGCVLVSFLAIELLTFCVYLLAPEGTLPFGVASALTFLIVVTLEGVYTWSKMRHRA